MGNWKSVNIVGSCDPAEVSALRAACTVNGDYSNFHCLSITRSLCGLNNWIGESINAIGNLAERDFEVEDVAGKLRELIKVAPSLKVKIHCGGEYEDKNCVATVTVEDGHVTVGPPEVKTLMEVSEAAFIGNMFKAMAPNVE